PGAQGSAVPSRRHGGSHRPRGFGTGAGKEPVSPTGNAHPIRRPHRTRRRVGLGRSQVIVLDTHIWVWWVHGDEKLRARQLEILQQNEKTGLGVSVISCWEIAKLLEL